jgi:hypothetical protein
MLNGSEMQCLMGVKCNVQWECNAMLNRGVMQCSIGV